MNNVNEFQNHLYLQWAGKVFEADKEYWSIIPQWHLNQIVKDKEWSYINCKSNNITYLELIQNGFGQEVVAVYLDMVCSAYSGHWLYRTPFIPT